MSIKFMVFTLTVSMMCGAMAQEYKSPDYTVKLFDNYLKDSGLMAVSVDDKILFSRNVIFVHYKNSEGKTVEAKEQGNPAYTWKDDVLTSTKKIGDRNGKVLAEVTKTMTFAPQSVAVKIKVVALESFNLPNTWNYYREMLQIPTRAVTGVTVEGISKDGAQDMALIPQVYDKEKWGFRKTYSSVKFISDKYVISIVPSKNSRLRVIHYGGSNIEIYIAAPAIRTKQIEAGTIAEWGYTILFAKPQE